MAKGIKQSHPNQPAQPIKKTQLKSAKVPSQNLKDAEAK